MHRPLLFSMHHALVPWAHEVGETAQAPGPGVTSNLGLGLALSFRPQHCGPFTTDPVFFFIHKTYQLPASCLQPAPSHAPGLQWTHPVSGCPNRLVRGRSLRPQNERTNRLCLVPWAIFLVLYCPFQRSKCQNQIAE